MRAIALRPNPAGHAAPITHVTLRADGRRLATCSYDGTVVVWDVTQPRHPRRLTQLRHRRLVNAAAWNPVSGLLATASADKTVAVWQVGDSEPAQVRTVLARHTDDVNAVAWMPNGRDLICVSQDGRATLWDTVTGALRDEVGNHGAHCMMVSVGVHGLVATVGEDGMVSVLDPRRRSSRVTRHYESSIEGCAWSHSGSLLAVARDDGAVDLLTPQLNVVRTIRVSDAASRSVAFSDDDGTIVVGAYDGRLHVFDTAGGLRRRVSAAALWPRSVSTAGDLVAVGSFGSGPHLFSLHSGDELYASAEPNHGVNALAADGDRLVVGGDSGIVFAVDLAHDSDEPPVHRVAALDSPVLSLAARDGVVHAGTYAGDVVRIDGGTVTAEPVGAPVPALCRTADALVAGTYNGDLIGLDPVSLRVRDRGTPHHGSVKSLVAFRDGFVSASTDRTVADGTLRRRAALMHHGNLVNAVAVLGDTVVASASRDHTVQVAMVAPVGGPPVLRQTLLGPDESVKAVCLLGDPAAPIVLAGSYDFGVYAWRVDWHRGGGALTEGRIVTMLDQAVSCMVPLDGNRAAVAGWDGRLLIVGPDRSGQIRVLRSLDADELAGRALRREAVAA